MISNKELKLPTAKCSKCGYTWTPRTGEPKVCPDCKSRKWRKKVKKDAVTYAQSSNYLEEK